MEKCWTNNKNGLLQWKFNQNITICSQENAFQNGIYKMVAILFWPQCAKVTTHYDDVIMGAIASQITSLTIVYSTVYSDADQRKHQSSASLAFVRRIHRGPVNSLHKWPVTRKMFPFDDVIIMSPDSWGLFDWQRLGQPASRFVVWINNQSEIYQNINPRAIYFLVGSSFRGMMGGTRATYMARCIVKTCLFDHLY